MNRKNSLYSFFFVVLLIGLTIVFTACGESATERAQRHMIDSLENVNAQARMDYKDLQQYLSIIAGGLDSISIEEHELQAYSAGAERRGLNRQMMKHQLNHVRDLLSRHRERIAILEQKLDVGNKDAQNLRIIIFALRRQVDEKEREIEKLRIDLENNRKSMSELTGQMQQMQEVQEEQMQTISEQNETIQHQADKLNKGYIKIASKKELKSVGLLTGGFLKKSKVDYSRIDLNLFQCVDIRITERIDLPEKVKILSPMPKGSYEIKPGENGGNVLHILDMKAFWSVSRFLIIQIN